LQDAFSYSDAFRTSSGYPVLRAPKPGARPRRFPTGGRRVRRLHRERCPAARRRRQRLSPRRRRRAARVLPRPARRAGGRARASTRLDARRLRERRLGQVGRERAALEYLRDVVGVYLEP